MTFHGMKLNRWVLLRFGVIAMSYQLLRINSEYNAIFCGSSIANHFTINCVSNENKRYGEIKHSHSQQRVPVA